MEAADKLMVSAMIRVAIENLEQSNNQEAIDTKEIEKRIHKKVDDFLSRIDKEKILKLFSETLDSRLSEMERNLKTQKEYLDVLNHKTGPVQMEQSIRQLWDKHHECMAHVQTMKNDFQKNFLDRFITKIDDSDLKELYLQSGLRISDIMKEFHVEQTRAYDYVNGKVTDIRIRSKLRDFYLNHIQTVSKI